MFNNFIKKYRHQFFQDLAQTYPDSELEAIFRLAIEYVFNKEYFKVLLESKLIYTSKQEELLHEILIRLQTYEPIQHIIGKAHFYDLEFKVNPHVLIPRQETELLVHTLINRLKNFEKPEILDIGTGSGCIAISLKTYIKDALVSALDISQQALNTAKENAIENEVEINFIQCDILSPEINFDSMLDVIVSNPPYVRNSEKTEMHLNVTKFDPKLALYVNDDDPLLFYRAITDFALRNLKTNGLLAFEINEAFGSETEKLVLDNGFYASEIIKDLNNKDRFIIAKKQ